MAISSIALSVDNCWVFSGQKVTATLAITSSTTTTLSNLQLYVSNPTSSGYFGTPSTWAGFPAMTAGTTYYITVAGVAYDNAQPQEAGGTVEQFTVSAQALTADGGSGSSNSVTLFISPYVVGWQGYTAPTGYQTGFPGSSILGVPTAGSLRFDSNLLGGLVAAFTTQL